MFAEVKAEDWLWIIVSQKREKADKDRDKPRMVGNTVGGREQGRGFQKEDINIKEKQLKDESNQRPSQMNDKKCLLSVAIRTSLAISWRGGEQ